MTETVTRITHIPLSVKIEQAVLGGDLSILNNDDRLTYYKATCQSLGLNYLTQPFAYLTLNGKLVLYAKKNAKEQLRNIHNISLRIMEERRQDDLYIVRVKATNSHGREDEDIGYAVVRNLKDDALGNAMLKAVTKAKSRTTLSICGLSIIDETEIDSISGAVIINPDVSDDGDTGHLEMSSDDISNHVHPTTDQIISLVELARACDVDLVSFGQQMRQLMNLSDEAKVTKKFLRESMTIDQFEAAYEHYTQLLKHLVVAEADASDAGVDADDARASAAEPSTPSELTQDQRSPTDEGHQTDEGEIVDPGARHRVDETPVTPNRWDLVIDDDGFVHQSELSKLLKLCQKHRRVDLWRKHQMTGGVRISAPLFWEVHDLMTAELLDSSR